MIIEAKEVSSEQGQNLINDLRDRYQTVGDERRQIVEDIIMAVRKRGDDALLEYTNKFDSPELTIDRLRVSGAEIAAAEAEVSADLKRTINKAISRVRTFHEHEKQE